MSQPRYNILVAEPLSDDALQRLHAVANVRLLDTHDEATLAAAIHDCDALVVRTYVHVTASLIRAAPRLKVIARAGTGLDNVDLQAAKARGVMVVHTPAAATNAVAEHTVALILALERHLLTADRLLRSRSFIEARKTLISRELRGLTLGVIGMGRIGRVTAGICHHGLGMTILYHDIREVGPLPFHAEPADKKTIYQRADVLTLHVPLTEESRHLIDETALHCLQPSATLINTSRGAVIDVLALADALHRGQLAGAAIDVHHPEPPPPDYPLLAAPNCLLTPHLASRTPEALDRMNDVVDDLIAVLRGKPPAYPAC